MNRVLLTGATGFIGTKLVYKLLENNVSVAHIVPTEELAVTFSDEVDCFVARLDNLDCIAGGIEYGSCDILYHLAWDGVSTDAKNDYERQFLNVIYSLNVCRLALKIGCKKIVIPGSASEYAYVDSPVDGLQVPCPADAYGAAKSAAHIACDLFARQNDLSLNWLLVSSIYGPDRFDSNIITYSINAFLTNAQTQFTALEQQWDYLYIDDLIRALFLVGLHGKKRKVYPVGSGQARALKEYVEIIRNEINPCAEMGVGVLPYKTDRIDNSIIDSSALREDTGFLPQYSFERGVALVIESHRSRLAKGK